MSAPLHGQVGSFWFSKQNALSFDATNETVTIPDSTSINITSDMTLEVWCNIDTGGYNDFIVAKGDPATEPGWALMVLTSDARFVMNNVAETQAQSTTKINTGEWTHLVGTIEGVLPVIYVNGELENSGSGDLGSFTNTSDLIFGATSAATGTTKIGVVRLFDRAATGAEVSDLYSGKFPRTTLFDALKAEWLFTEGTGTNLTDAGKNAQDGTIANATWVSTTYDTATAEAVGTGDGTTTAFSLDNENVEDGTGLAVTVGGVTKTKGNDFTITPKGTITFSTAPANLAAVIANYRYYPMTLEAGGFLNWSTDLSCDTPETTEFRNTGWRSYVAGLKGFSGTADRHWLNPLNGLLSKKCILRLYTDVDNDTYLTGWGIINGLNPSIAVDALVDESVSFQGTGTIGTETT